MYVLNCVCSVCVCACVRARLCVSVCVSVCVHASAVFHPKIFVAGGEGGGKNCWGGGNMHNDSLSYIDK